MEYVKGVPVTEYADSRKLSTRDRLRLFLEVCGGVQHAHQKGIIHRDIKPSNILVAFDDGRPVPKIIDFGVAKATSQRLTERTLFTELGQWIGTPEYMSPEQAEMTGLDVDTRSDVYSLGVVLYELLAGAQPFDSKELRTAGFDEMRRKIREDEPPKPSTRVSSLGAASQVRGRTAPHGHPGAGADPARRPRLDRDEGAGEGSLAALRFGVGAGGGCRPLPLERAGRGQSAGHDLPGSKSSCAVTGWVSPAEPWWWSFWSPVSSARRRVL